MKNLNICIAGLGNVGSSVLRLIELNSSYVKNKSNLNLNIIGIAAKNKNKKRSFNTKNYEWFDNPIDLLKINDVKPDILIELIGYEKDISYDLVKSALDNKIHVVTGNRQCLQCMDKNFLELQIKIKYLYFLKQQLLEVFQLLRL